MDPRLAAGITNHTEATAAGAGSHGVGAPISITEPAQGLVYNTFPLPLGFADADTSTLELLAQAVLDARAAHPAATLADLYDPDLMPPNLRRAHHALDRAVDRLYRRKRFTSERDRVEHLFALYEREWSPSSWRNPGFPQTDRYPVTCVSWDAQAYVSWLSRTTGARYRLPTEAEWDRAAAGPQPGCYRRRTGSRGTCPVGSYGSNVAGLSDMVGNVDELTEDSGRVTAAAAWCAAVDRRRGHRQNHLCRSPRPSAPARRAPLPAAGLPAETSAAAGTSPPSEPATARSGTSTPPPDPSGAHPPRSGPWTPPPRSPYWSP